MRHSPRCGWESAGKALAGISGAGRLTFCRRVDTIIAVKNILHKTDVFKRWLDSLQDQKGRARILSRIFDAESGNFGDCRPVGGGISEMRVRFGPGYRVYYGQRDENTYLLIAGGDKSAQSRDIARAKALWRMIKE